MDFFARQDQARKRTRWLIAYFCAAVLLTILAVYLVVTLVFQFQQLSRFETTPFWNPPLFAWVTLGIVALVGGASLFKIAELSRGGSAVATALGGRLLNPNTTDVDELKLRNVVEEMSIASGTPVPEIYILDDEPGINAFAAGNSTADAAVGVTRGAMRLLSRDELQGVIAHEFSHILNGDMRLNLRLIGWVHGIICIALIGRALLRTARVRTGNRKGGNPLPILGLGLMIVGGIGMFFGRLIKSAISRQREHLADAAAVQFTRNPAGLCGALKKIGGLVYGSRLQASGAEEASHMFFGNGLGESWFTLMSTHPPLEQRIRLLDPSFDGNYPRVLAERAPEVPPPVPPAALPVPPPQLSDLLGPRGGVPAAAALASVGVPQPVHLAFGSGLLQALPPSLTAAAHEPFSATGLIYALLLSPDESARAGQTKALRPHAAEGVLNETNRLLADVAQVDDVARLPLIELALPALRQLSKPQYERFSRNVKLLIEADRRMDLFEYALQKLLVRHLDQHFTPAPRRAIQYYSLRGLVAESAVLLPGTALSLYPVEDCTLSRLDAALDRLAQASPQCKKQFLQAAARTIAADGSIQTREAELLRAIAESLECPMPPFVNA